MGNDRLRVESSERVDLEDFEFLSSESMDAAVQNLPGNVLTNPDGTRAWVITGFEMTNPSGAQLQVDRGVAILSRRRGGVVEYGVVAADGDAQKILDLATYSIATYGIYIRFEAPAGDQESRIFWDASGSGSEFAQSIATRYLANWGLRVESTSPGAEWLYIGDVQVSAGPAISITDRRDLYFEGEVDNSYANRWGSGTDRNSDRQQYGIRDFQTFTEAVRTILEEWRPPGSRWYELDGLYGAGQGASGPGVEGVGASGNNGPGIKGTGDGTGAGGEFTGGTSGPGVTGAGGAGSNDPGVSGTGGTTNGVGVSGQGTGTGSGVEGTGGATNGVGVSGQGVGTGSGVEGTGGPTDGVGVKGTGDGQGSGVEGVASGDSNLSAGISGVGDVTGAASASPGVKGVGAGAGSGGYFTGGATGVGVSAVASGNTAVKGVTTATGTDDHGGDFKSDGGFGVSAWANNSQRAALHLVPQSSVPSSPGVGDIYIPSSGGGRPQVYDGTSYNKIPNRLPTDLVAAASDQRSTVGDFSTTYTIPANSLKDGSVIKVTAVFNEVTNGTDAQLTLQLNGTNIADISVLSTAHNEVVIEAKIYIDDVGGGNFNHWSSAQAMAGNQYYNSTFLVDTAGDAFSSSHTISARLNSNTGYTYDLRILSVEIA